jgi:hypothetical protein
MKTLFFIGITLFVMGCKTGKNANPDQITDTTMEDSYQKPQKLVAKIGDLSEGVSEGILISEVVVDGNNMEIEISYSGCQRPVFELTGSSMIAKSLPPIRAIRLSHDGQTGDCKKLINERLIFDLKAFAYQQEEGSEMVLQLEGWKEKIKYTYTTK